ncbi:GNAT family N-acetyltransferase [Paracidobacterium acidisoli]|uniref:GNAT family N-acetyltransferase n=1 Tax=Paracidobacterium acidisoli TaxID=2303751 RepID=UPI001314F728|nr:GNAT family N-acetyltransferase [Paracidobacterium acidisoli]
MRSEVHLRAGIVLREIRREDLDALFVLDQVCFRPGIAYSRTELRYFLLHPKSISLLAEECSAGPESARIAGFVIAGRVFHEGCPLGHIITIDVDPALRGRGVGSMLMEMAEHRLHEAGAASIRLEVAVDNVAAQKFYLRHGYKQTGRIRGFYMGTLDALVMEKPLSAAKR